MPYRANIHALRQLGVRYLISLSAVGSLSEEMKPLDMVLPDQFIDLTKRRDSTFFGAGAVAHVSMAQPVCPNLANVLSRAIGATKMAAGFSLHCGGTYVCIEGPQFSTLAESLWYRSMGAKVMGMTNMPEAKLAKEAQMAYATLAMVTDYDCWHPREAHVTAIQMLGAGMPFSAAHTALQPSLVTQPADMAPETLDRLRVFLT